jgi:hypothetical protein
MFSDPPHPTRDAVDIRDLHHTHPLRATVAFSRQLFQLALNDFEEKPASMPRTVEPPTQMFEVDEAVPTATPGTAEQA